MLQQSKPMQQTQRLDFSSNGQQNSQVQPIRILLVDDSRVIREGLKAMLASEKKLLVVGSANDGQAAIEQVEVLRPDIVLMDIKMPVMDGVTATRIITQTFAETKVLSLSSQSSDYYVTQMLEAGAKGYLLKDTPGSELAKAIEAVHLGYGHVGPGMFKNFNTNLFATKDVALEQAPLESKEVLPSDRDLERVKLELMDLKTQLGRSFGHQQFLELHLGLTRAAVRNQQRDIQGLRKLLNVAIWIGVIVFCIVILLLVFRFVR